MVTIIKGVNFPKATRTSKAEPLPFDGMEVGDMFFLAGRKTCSAVTAANKASDTKKFVMRKYEQDGVAGIGVWRQQ
jgi:hypothetical protein